ncbi:hypothetical protein [Vibrio atypicus]|uniref:hypothetical protein n=1 Tax=Vibrio atypicus TaxID=558271 RepID=UPI001358B33A|nr:hypothetical protein [Vibrio atypicus]
MKDRSSYDYIHIGLILRALQHGSYSYKFAVEHVKLLLELLEEVNFEVSISFTDADDFYEIIETIDNKHEEDPNATLPDEEIEELSKQLNGLEKVVFAESSTKKIYTIPSRRFNSKYLLNTPERFFTDGHFDALSDMAKTDISSASRCIVFGEGTAAAFHILRATEDTLKQYYFLHRKQKRLQKPMWANMVDQLKAKKTNGPSKVLLDSLNMVRESYRNPTQHPEATYTIDTAQDLFGVCIDVIGKMAKEL